MYNRSPLVEPYEIETMRFILSSDRLPLVYAF